jgi:hypothetical protein
MQASLKVTPQLLLLDLGEVRRLITQDGPRLARFVAAIQEKRTGCTRQGGQNLNSRLMRAGALPAQTLIYTLPGDPLDFEQDGSRLLLPGLRLYLDGPPEFVETPFYAWVEP